MAGYSNIYCVGGLGGYMGSDGINPIFFQILVGEADRQWMEVHYFDKSIKPIGKIKRIIPYKPNDQNMLLDACIIFFPENFKECPSLKKISRKIENLEMVEFNASMLKKWKQLREEATPFFKRLNIFEAKLIRLKIKK